MVKFVLQFRIAVRYHAVELHTAHQIGNHWVIPFVDQYQVDIMQQISHGL